MSDSHLEQRQQILGYPRAGLFRRLASILYDGIIVGAIWMLFGFIMQLVVGPDTSELVDGRVRTDPVLGNILFFLMLTSCAAFFGWFWTRSGQTVGMLAWRIKVVDRDGGPVSVRQAAVRLLLAWPAFCLLGLGYLWLFVDAEGDALHDKISGTRVVVVPKAG